MIWKDPVTQMQRKGFGLLHKSVRENASMCRQGIPDYLITMRSRRRCRAREAHGRSYPVGSGSGSLALYGWILIRPIRCSTNRPASMTTGGISAVATRSYPARRGALDDPGDVVSIAVRGDRQRRICDAANGARFVGAELRRRTITSRRPGTSQWQCAGQPTCSA